jgi:hypothetical protein
MGLSKYTLGILEGIIVSDYITIRDKNQVHFTVATEEGEDLLFVAAHLREERVSMGKEKGRNLQRLTNQELHRFY